MFRGKCPAYFAEAPYPLEIVQAYQWVQRNPGLNGPALTAMLLTIIANNRAGGWRKLKRGR